jgi:hypothetical protein
LFNNICLFSGFTAIEGFHFKKNRFVFPLACLLILSLVVDGEAELGDFAPICEHAHFRIAR